MKIRLSLVFLVLGVIYVFYKLYISFNYFSKNTQEAILAVISAISVIYIFFCLITFKLKDCTVDKIDNNNAGYTNLLMLIVTILDDFIPTSISKVITYVSKNVSTRKNNLKKNEKDEEW